MLCWLSMLSHWPTLSGDFSFLVLCLCMIVTLRSFLFSVYISFCSQRNHYETIECESLCLTIYLFFIIKRQVSAFLCEALVLSRGAESGSMPRIWGILVFRSCLVASCLTGCPFYSASFVFLLMSLILCPRVRLCTLSYGEMSGKKWFYHNWKRFSVKIIYMFANEANFIAQLPKF